ncbi:MAG: hypothetical protein O8C66_08415 [Candidatus Methanoperedens sp.]|nr:hypothetical protein [Candidatus Methanoperedens sp.]MCZ7370520.1 hypothetical protein [Candidatus Methanoperedens sp.]
MKYLYKIVIVLILIYTGIYPAFADEIEWVDPQEKTLRFTDSFTREGFQIEATGFYNNTDFKDLMALITVYDSDHRLVTSNITRINDSFSIDNRLNITIIDLQDRFANIGAAHGVNAIADQWVKIRTRVPGTPLPKLSVLPAEKHFNNRTIVSRIFAPGSEISINFTIRNDGKGSLRSPTLQINTSLPPLAHERLDYELPELKAGNESDIITVRFKAPYITEGKSFQISAEVNGNDVLRRAYKAVDSTYIEVREMDKRIMFGKFVSEKIYMGDIAVVSLSLTNNLSLPIDNVSLTDSLPPDLEPLDTNLSWNFSLGPLEHKLISYAIKPQKPGTYLLMPGSSIFEYPGGFGYNEKPAKLIVNGPYVVLVKSANIINPVVGENISVTVEAKNQGDATAIVKLSDGLPPDNSISNASPEKYKVVLNTVVLHSGESASFSYALNANASGSFVIPPAKAIVLDQFLYLDERYTQRAVSNYLVLDVREPLKLEGPAIEVTRIPVQTATPGITGTPVTTPKPASGFQGYIFIMLFIVIWLIKRHNFRR